MILVTGATGSFGRIAVECLLRELAPVDVKRIAALAREPAKAADLAARRLDVRRGDYTDYPSLTRAFQGVDKLLFVSTSALSGVVEQHANVIRAAKHAGVRHVVFTSIVSRSAEPAFRLVRDYRQTEHELMASGLTFTILRNGYYMDMLPMLIGDAVETGTIRYPAGNGQNNFTARSDLAEAAVNVLLGSGHEQRVYEACGPIAYSFGDVAKALSDATGKKIEYADLPLGRYHAELAARGVRSPELELMIGLAESIRSSEGRCQGPQLEALLGRPPMSIARFFHHTSLTSTG